MQPQQQVEKADKHPRSPPKVDQASPNPGASKRVKGKQPNPDMVQQLDDLREAHQFVFLQKTSNGTNLLGLYCDDLWCNFSGQLAEGLGNFWVLSMLV